MKKVSIKRLVERRVAKAIEEYEKSRANLDGAGSSGGNNGNAGRTMNVQGSLDWKSEQVFETGKCAEEDKVMFAASTFEGRALTWWTRLHTLGLANATTQKGDDIEAKQQPFPEQALDGPNWCPLKEED
ncbi:hypothetical protein Tco_0261032 [Tanacetum coccineum]